MAEDPSYKEWGRDTFISMCGRYLIPKHFDVAKQILAKYARYERNGLIPNRISVTGEALYNTVDTSLWYFQAVKSYLDYTDDLGFIKIDIYPVLKRIIHSLRIGTDFNIVMDADGLITADIYMDQYNRLDAKEGYGVMSTRPGKAVDVNALWYNALILMTLLANVFQDRKTQKLCGELAELVQENFPKTFWSSKHNYLADTVYHGEKDERLRPNQLFAVSLPYRLLTAQQEKSVVCIISHHLYTPCGIRTLPPNDKDYPKCTKWLWLLGPYVSAYRKVHAYSRASHQVASKIFLPFFHQIHDPTFTSTAEDFEERFPYIPRGCPYQALSIAELLRAYVQEVLEWRPQPNWLNER